MKKLIISLLLLFGISCRVFAEEEIECELVSAGPITTWTAPVCCKGEFVIQPFLFYNRTRGIFDYDSDYHSLPEGDKKYQFQQQLFAQYGITNRFEIDGQIVLQENYIKENGESADSTGLSDSFLFLRYCAIEESKNIPHITGLFQVRLPTGKYENLNQDNLGTDLMGTGSYDPGFGVIMTKTVRPFMFHLDAIFSVPIETDIDGVETKYGNYLNYDFGVEYFLPKGFNFLLEFNGLVQGDTKEDGDNIDDSNVGYLIGGLGIGWSKKKIQTLLAYQRTLLGTNTDANDSVIFTFVYKF